MPQDPKNYVLSKGRHCHAPMDGGEICFNYNDLLLRKWAVERPSDIQDFSLNSSERMENYLSQVPPPTYPSDFTLSINNPRIGHPDNPKYKAEFFDSYNAHGHTPFEGGEIIWNSKQWAQKINFELNLYRQIVPSGIANAVSSVIGESVAVPSGENIVPYNLHSHSDIEGGIIAQNEWMAKAIENKRIENFNQSEQSDFTFKLQEYTQEDFPFDESILTGESQKSGTGASGILEITDPLPTGHKGFVNPAITVPAFGTEVIFNDRQLFIVLNKLIELGLIKKPGGGYFTVPEQPTKAYNVHRHTSEFDGGFLGGRKEIAFCIAGSLVVADNVISFYARKKYKILEAWAYADKAPVGECLAVQIYKNNSVYVCLLIIYSGQHETQAVTIHDDIINPGDTINVNIASIGDEQAGGENLNITLLVEELADE